MPQLVCVSCFKSMVYWFAQLARLMEISALFANKDRSSSTHVASSYSCHATGSPDFFPSLHHQRMVGTWRIVAVVVAEQAEEQTAEQTAEESEGYGGACINEGEAGEIGEIAGAATTRGEILPAPGPAA